ncbi:MAG: competence/damage-inducible protein A [Ruminococcaceae bacterium]|nr:competence/damage-inducible protein A [Oscillospiraceae bacterium]
MEKIKINSAEILCVGTELLLGDIVNTNAAYLSLRLAELGISVYHHTVVGDNPERLKKAFSDALSRSELVLVTGGLGPTCDDLTRETAAELFSMPLELSKDILAQIRGYFSSSGREMTDNNKRQAMVPRGATVLHNDCGTAPGLMLERDGRMMMLMPGVPREMKAMYEKQILPILKERSDRTIVSRNVHLFGIGESAAESILIDMMNEGVNPTVAPYAKEGEVRIRVTAAAENEKAALSMCDETIEKIRATEVGKYIYGVDVGSLEAAVVKRLKEKKMTLSCAESCTGGLVAKRIVDIPGCSEVFYGSAVTYANSAKESVLGVDAKTLAEHGAVSADTAIEMARGARRIYGTDIAVSITGIAGPGGGTPEKPVGTVYMAISKADGEQVKKLSLSSQRDRDFLRHVATSNALHFVLEQLK